MDKRALSFNLLIAMACLLSYLLMLEGLGSPTGILAILIVVAALFVVTSIGASINDGPKKRFLSDDG